VVHREIEILDIGTPANALVELACLLSWDRSPFAQNMPMSGQDLAGWCCRGGGSR
jgi:hypothetical protein